MADFRHSHIVPAGYLRAWTEDGLVAVEWANGADMKLLPVRDVGVRSGFYGVAKGDGSYDYSFDPAMGGVEDAAIPVIREIETRWPLEVADRAVVAEFVALQMLRSPAWKSWYLSDVPRARRRLGFERLSTEEIEQAEQIAAGNAQRHQVIVESIPVLASVFANMHWTLLRCTAPRLVTSDHPVVPLEIDPIARFDQSPIATDGVLATAEVGIALSPRHHLLMTWSQEDDALPPVPMKWDLIRNHNLRVVGQAEIQWFHCPTSTPELAKPPAIGLAELLGGRRFDPHTQRLAATRQLVDLMMAEDPAPTDARIMRRGEII